MTLRAAPLTADAFAPFGEVIETSGDFRLINEGACRRFTDLARLDIVDGRPGLSLFQAEIRSLPHDCTLLERHPLGSQCFIPMQGGRYLVIVAPDQGGTPGIARAFVAEGHQCVNIARNTWHGVLCPIAGSGLFAVIDRIGAGGNLEEHSLGRPIRVTL
ncbi:ureidoglycolate lyase [Rhodovulum strictum]|uniref:Ureidoglycolate lyase n=1 Tax=Rhodovulum strictum TaxID=58314 RepID=A0A844BBJ1_9RHOB|nr:ureidoglycolate lyase [Rhodovulum strictum]MRH20008.1 ureidoglycolate lyase [Rhodovulum strictum]